MRNIILTRTSKNSVAIYGLLAVVEGDEVLYVCRTIENAVKSFPDGKYRLKLEHSPRFKMDLWELYGIPGRAEIKIHVANYYRQLDGCIGVGKVHQDFNDDAILDLGQSKTALLELMEVMSGQKEAEITVVSAYKPIVASFFSEPS